MHRSEFLKILKEEFPEIKDELNKQKGLFLLEMTVFHNFTNELIFKADLEDEKLIKCFNLAEMFYRKGNSKLKFAIDESFVEGLSFEGNKWAWKVFPDDLKCLYLQFHNELQ